MNYINEFLLLFDLKFIKANYFAVLLLISGLIITFYLKFPQIRLFKKSFVFLLNKKENDGDISSFAALTTALSGTIGTGNISGVAFAIYLGGPGSLFWMWVTAFLGMAIKYAEVTLSCMYRFQTETGSWVGGPMYYMRDGLGLNYFSKIFALALIISSFGIGNMPQGNNMAVSMNHVYGISPLIVALVSSIVLGFVVIGGISRIANLASKLIPFMSLVYIVGCAGVLIYNYNNIYDSFALIFKGAFSPTAPIGGFVGSVVVFSFSKGVSRGLFSNEAGMGSSPIAHISAKFKNPREEGAVALLEPFVDTILICTLTGLVILSSGSWHKLYKNEFDFADTIVVKNSPDYKVNADNLRLFFGGFESKLTKFTGSIHIENGKMNSDDLVLLNARSVAKNFTFSLLDEPFDGHLKVVDGAFSNTDVSIIGDSLLHSSELTSTAFESSVFGSKSSYLVPICLLLFAFSTAISWCYYGEQGFEYLFGKKFINFFRYLYVSCFFSSMFFDSSIIWKFATISTLLMSFPNIISVLMGLKKIKNAK